MSPDHFHGDTAAATSDLDIDGATISVQNIGNSGARDEINAVNINGTTGVTLNKPIYTGGSGNTIDITANSGNGTITLATGAIIDSLDAGGSNGTITLTGNVKGTQT